MKQGNTGFTLLELIVAVAIAAILAVIAIPSFTRTIRSNRGVTDANNVLSLLTMARSEAIKRDTSVSLCVSSDGATCATGTVTWDRGFLLFVDYKSNGNYDTTSPTTPDLLVRTEVPLSKNSTISYATTGGTALTSITFNGLGQLSSTSGATGNFVVLPTQGAGNIFGKRYVVLKQIGRAYVCDPTTNTTCGSGQ